MKRITQSLFEEIQKITSSQIEEKKKVDQDKDGDNDFADVMMARMKAGGKSHKEAHKHTRKHNEETEQEGEELEEELTSDQIEMHKQLAAKHRTIAKSSGGDKRVAHQRAANLHTGAIGNPWDTQGSSAALRSSKKLGVTMEEAEHVEEAWPGTPEHKAKHGSDFEKHMMKYGGDPKAARATKGRYGYEGASGSETPETAADSSKVGRGRKKMKEETIIKHEDFTLEIINNPTFKDFLDAAKPYVQTEEHAIAVAESFFQEEDTSLVIESQTRAMFESVLDSHRKEGVEVADMDISLKGEEVFVRYTVTESEMIRHYIHQGKIVKGEE